MKRVSTWDSALCLQRLLRRRQRRRRRLHRLQRHRREEMLEASRRLQTIGFQMTRQVVDFSSVMKMSVQLVLVVVQHQQPLLRPFDNDHRDNHADQWQSHDQKHARR